MFVKDLIELLKTIPEDYFVSATWDGPKPPAGFTFDDTNVVYLIDGPHVDIYAAPLITDEERAWQIASKFPGGK